MFTSPQIKRPNRLAAILFLSCLTVLATSYPRIARAIRWRAAINRRATRQVRPSPHRRSKPNRTKPSSCPQGLALQVLLATRFRLRPRNRRVRPLIRGQAADQKDRPFSPSLLINLIRMSSTLLRRTVFSRVVMADKTGPRPILARSLWSLIRPTRPGCLRGALSISSEVLTAVNTGTRLLSLNFSKQDRLFIGCIARLMAHGRMRRRARM